MRAALDRLEQQFYFRSLPAQPLRTDKPQRGQLGQKSVPDRTRIAARFCQQLFHAYQLRAFHALELEGDKRSGRPFAMRQPGIRQKRLDALQGPFRIGQRPEVISAPVQRQRRRDNFPNGARLAFVIDDAGQSRAALRRYLAVPLPLAIAVLPKLANTKESAAMVRAAGKELMLHQPMQAENLDLWAGPGAITPGMGLGEIKALIAENLAELGEGVRGLNNHEGSLITEDEVRIGAVLDAAQERGLFFMDSRTSAQTKAPDAARIRGMQILERDVFIDNVLEREAMLQQIREGLVLANKQGSAIMIGHVDKSADILPDLLTELAPLLRERGYQLVTPSQLLDR